MSERLNIEIVPCLDFEMIKNLENCLLVFDNSCEAICQKEAFIKLAVAVAQKTTLNFCKIQLFPSKEPINTTHFFFQITTRPPANWPSRQTFKTIRFCSISSSEGPRGSSDIYLLISIQKQVTSNVFAQIICTSNQVFAVFHHRLERKRF